MSRGVFDGMNTPNQIALSAFFRPASSGVGTSGRSATRLEVDTSSARTWPSRIRGSAVASGQKYRSIRPADDVSDHFGAAAIGHMSGLDAGGETKFLGAD